MIGKTNKKTKALDTKMSSAFLFSEECYKNFSTISFNNDNHKGYALLLMNIFYKPTDKGDNFRYFGSHKLSNITSNYNKLLKILEDSSIIEIKKGGSNKYFINPEYIGTCEISDCDKQLYEYALKKVEIKLEKRALKSNSLNYTFDITEEEIEKELWEYRECDAIYDTTKTLQQSINYQKYLVNEIKNNNLKLHQNTDRRCYSNFTMLSSNFHKYFKIADENVVEIDTHATFISFLPLVCRRYISKLMYNKQKYENLLESDPENDLYKNIIQKNIELMTGSEECILRFENVLKFLFENHTNFYEFLQNNISKKYDSCKFKKAVNSFLMSNDQNKVDRYVHDYFLINYPEICKLINDMRTQNFYWRQSEYIEVDIFTEAGEDIIFDGGNCLTKFDGILVQESLKNKTIHHLYENFNKLGIFTIFKIIEHKTQETFKLNLKEAQIISEEFEKNNLQEILNHPQADLPSEESSLVSDKNKNYNTSSGQGEGGHRDIDFSLSDTKKRDKEIFIRPHRKGFQISIKNKKYYSTSKETKEDFYNRIIKNEEIPNDIKKLIKFEDNERSECRIVETAIKNPLTQTFKDVILKEVEEKALEVVFRQDMVKMGKDIIKPQKPATEAKNDQSDESSVYIEENEFIKLLGLIK